MPEGDGGTDGLSGELNGVVRDFVIEDRVLADEELGNALLCVGGVAAVLRLFEAVFDPLFLKFVDNGCLAAVLRLVKATPGLVTRGVETVIRIKHY